MKSRSRRRERTSPPAKTGRMLAVLRVAFACTLLGLGLLPLLAQDDATAKNAEPVTEKLTAAPLARIVSIPLPLTSKGDESTNRQVEAAIERLVKVSVGKVRPLLILEFVSVPETSGEGSEFESALRLARTITSDKVSGVRTVAFLPRSVKGHAVLPVIACDEIVMASEAVFGSAGIDEDEIGPLLRASYEEIAARRRTVPPALALGMLDRNVSLLKVQTKEGSRIVSADELEELKRTATVVSEDTIKPQGELLEISGADGRHKLGFVSHLASDRETLQTALKLSPKSLQDDPLAGVAPHAIRVDFSGPVHPRVVDRVKKILSHQLQNGEINLVVLWIRSNGGSMDDGLEMSNFLVHDIDHDRVKVVAYVSDQARGSAALIALSADELVMEEAAILGGPGVASFSQEELEAHKLDIQQLMQQRQRAWSPALGLLGWQTPVRRYTNARTGESSLFSDEEHAALRDKDDWAAGVDAVALTNGIGAGESVDLGLARHTARRLEDVNELYNVEGDIPTAGLNWALDLIKRLADPRMSGVLLFVGTFALFSELSQPGLGLPGFIAAVCFLLFFWANFLQGTAEWLELLLFAAGVACLFVEIFIAPGTMIFGVGGVLMIVTSIVLASQTFVLPTNSYQLQQVPGSLFMVIGAGAGAIVGLFVLQRFLPHTPYFRRLILQPPAEEGGDETPGSKKLTLEQLEGQPGVAVTPLVPAGKVQIGDNVYDVVSEGTLIDPGVTVIVKEVLGSRIVVRRA